MIALLLTGCNVGEKCEDMRFERLSAADRVVVSIDSKSVGDPIVEADKIQALSAFALSHSDGWSVNVMGPPVARLSAQFYQGAKFLGDFGVGAKFASAQGCGHFQTRELPKSQVAQFARLLGVSEAEAEWK